jgi:hypothetical protein
MPTIAGVPLIPLVVAEGKCVLTKLNSSGQRHKYFFGVVVQLNHFSVSSSIYSLLQLTARN